MMFPTVPLESSVAMATSAIRWAALARSSTNTDERTFALPPPISWIPRFLSPATAATTDSPSSEMPLKLPRSTFQARTACLPAVSASLPMMQPPVKTSAVRASTYFPLSEAPLRAPLPAISGELPSPTSAARTIICVFIATLSFL